MAGQQPSLLTVALQIVAHFQELYVGLTRSDKATGGNRFGFAIFAETLPILRHEPELASREEALGALRLALARVVKAIQVEKRMGLEVDPRLTPDLINNILSALERNPEQHSVRFGDILATTSVAIAA